MSERLGCAALSREAGEDPAGTASVVRRWLLVEQPGSWGADALQESRLPAGVGSQIAEAAAHVQARPLLIRRHGRDAGTAAGSRTVFAAVTTARARWIERFTVADPAQILDLDLTPMVDGRSVGGEPVDEPLFLVCTNGRHDACCAELGRPVAATLSALEPEATWECSHFGGDRFAGNVVCLPHGLYYGRVTPAMAGPLTQAYRAGRLDLAHLRGRSSYPFPVQAAEIAVRRATDNDVIDDLVCEARDDRDGVVRTTFRDRRGSRYTVDVAVRRDTAPRVLSCGAAPLPAPRYEAQLVTRR